MAVHSSVGDMVRETRGTMRRAKRAVNILHNAALHCTNQAALNILIRLEYECMLEYTAAGGELRKVYTQ
jgi:hypothetical protein